MDSLYQLVLKNRKSIFSFHLMLFLFFSFGPIKVNHSICNLVEINNSPMYKYLGSELIVVHDDGVVVRKKLVVSGLEKIVVSLKLFCFPTSSAILKPDSHLPWL